MLCIENYLSSFRMIFGIKGNKNGDCIWELQYEHRRKNHCRTICEAGNNRRDQAVMKAARKEQPWQLDFLSLELNSLLL